MTAGYDPSNPVASGSSDGYESDRPRHAATDYDDPERPGPLPPRMTSTGSFAPVTGSIPAQASPAGSLATGSMATGSLATGSLPAQPTSSWPASAPVTPPPTSSSAG